MYPLLKRDDQTLQYVVWTLGWNYLVGYNPIKVVNLKLRWIGYVSLCRAFRARISLKLEIGQKDRV